MAGIFSTLSVARSALLAQDAAIRVTGQNIANADTEGYTRQRVTLSAAQPERLGALSIGTGVEITRIERLLDSHIQESIRNAASSLNELATRSRVLGNVETVLNDLTDYGLGQALEQFFAALNDLAARPEDLTLRNQVVSAANSLGDAFSFAMESLTTLRADLNDEIETAAGEINRLATEIAHLNQEIVEAEHGGLYGNSANDLRDRRDLLLHELSEYVDLKAIETSTGAVNVMVDSDWLVFGRDVNSLTLSRDAEEGVTITTARLSRDGKLFAPSSGSYGALLEARDQSVPQYLADVNDLGATLINQINRAHSQAEGLTRLTSVTGTNAAASPTAQLDQAGLSFSVTDGRFYFTVKNENTDHVDTYDIAVNLSGSQTPINLNDLAQLITSTVASDHPEITASVTNDFRLAITSSSTSSTFGFQEDSSGVLAALGINTFFSGTGARDMQVNPLVAGELAYLAASHGTGAGDNSGVLAMLAVRDSELVSGATLEDWWQSRVGALGVARAEALDLADNQQAIYDNLVNQREALSGVNIDEEAINLMKYQRAYQAAAKLLAVVDELVVTLLNAV